MALKQLMLGKKLEALRQKLQEFETREAELQEKRAGLQQREETLSAAIEEVTGETSAEEKETLEEEMSKFEADTQELEQQTKDTQQEKEQIERQIAELQNELEELESRSAAAAKQEQRKDEPKMENRKFFNMSAQERDAFFTRQDVKEFCDRVRSLAKEKRSVTGAELLIPTVVLDILRPRVEEASKLLKHVNLRSVPGKARQTVAGTIPEAVWTEQCAKLNELAISFTGVEVDGYKVGGFVPVCNATLEDADNVALASEIITMLGRAIGMALDKAILYGTGKKMPHGIVPRLVEASQPEDYQDTDREWVDLSTSNVVAITGKTGLELFQEIVTAAGAAKSKYSMGRKFWAMNEKTWNKLLVNAMSTNAMGAIVSGQGMTMPVTGGDVELLEFMPDDVIVGGYGDLYLLTERAGMSIAQSEHVRFIEDQTVFRGTARYDGMPVIGEGFVAIGIGGTKPTGDAVTFPTDSANP